MTEKEKAQELINNVDAVVYGDIKKLNLKVIAILICDEIMNSYPTTIETYNNSKGLNVIHVDNRDYWNKVKKEIEKL